MTIPKAMIDEWEALLQGFKVQATLGLIIGTNREREEKRAFISHFELARQIHF